MNQPLIEGREYQLHIRAENEIYTSEFQSVPKIPVIDSIYVEHTEQLIITGTDVAAGKLQKTPGAQVYIDINDNGDVYNYRFTGRKVCQYTYNITIPMFGSTMDITVFAWLSRAPQGVFNIAAPPGYSASNHIRKHPLVFLERTYNVFKPDTQTYFNGWIYIFHQYAISNQTYQFYKDLNSQLTAEGKLFDPLYTQARGNMICTTNPGKKMLGNFEIASMREYRFFLQATGSNEYFLKPIPYFWFIPASGNSREIPPEWWESRSKTYPENN
jgi:hypothetical protein